MAKVHVGEPVLEGHIVPYHKKNCSLGCTDGWIGVYANKNSDKPEKRACGCAIRRFLIERPDVIRDDKGGLFYPPGGLQIKTNTTPPDALPGRVTVRDQAPQNQARAEEKIADLELQMEDARQAINEAEQLWEADQAPRYDRLEELDRLHADLEASIKVKEIDRNSIESDVTELWAQTEQLFSDHLEFEKQTREKIKELEQSILESSKSTDDQAHTKAKQGKEKMQLAAAILATVQPTLDLMEQNRVAHRNVQQELQSMLDKLERRLRRKRNTIYQVGQRIVRQRLRYNLDSSVVEEAQAPAELPSQ